MTRLTILIAAIFFYCAAMSARTIQGEIRTDKDSTIIAGASCRLMSGSRLINGVTSNDKGIFDISTDVKSRLILEISMTGFNTTEIVIESGNNINVGTVYLSEGITLNELQVSANSMVDSKGRTIIFPSGADVRASSTAISLFQKLPLAGLEANPINRSLSVDGGTPVILINGVPSDIDDFNALQHI